MLKIIMSAAAGLALLHACSHGQSVTTEPGQAPDLSERGIAVGEEGLAELVGKVAGRDDANCSSAAENVQLCLIKDGAEAYVYTGESHLAHGAALFRGLVEREGEVVFEERGWYAGDEAIARTFFDEAADMVPVLTIETGE